MFVTFTRLERYLKSIVAIVVNSNVMEKEDLFTTDTRYFSRTFLIEFINVYHQHPALWKMNSKVYSNKTLKNKGYSALIDVCRKFKVNANKEFIAKKIQSLRGSFRKEYKKVKLSERGGVPEDVYTPSLWYYDLLTFTVDVKASTESYSDLDNSPAHVSLITEIEEEDENEEEEKFVERLGEEIQETQFEIYNPLQNDRKRKRIEKNNENTDTVFPIGEFDAVGINVAAKLKKMTPDQQIYAEGLINKILIMGLMQQLTDETDVPIDRIG